MKFKNHLQNIKATVYDAPTLHQLAGYIPEFVCLTWLEDIDQLDTFMFDRKLSRKDLVNEAFARRTLPTALETIRVTFFLEGLDLTNVTHCIRHRMFSFSAQSTDPVTMENHDILENDAFVGELAERARQLCRDANDLYKDALDQGLSYYDARHYQVRAKEAKYFMSGNVKDFIDFVNVRLGRTNQPTSDNILAAQIRKGLINLYPQIESQMPLEKVQMHYVGAINEKMNMNTYPPDKLHAGWLMNNGVNWDKAVFNHPLPRDEYPHMFNFNETFKRITQ